MTERDREFEKQIDLHESEPHGSQTPDAWTYIGYGLAAVILLPIGIYLKAEYAHDVGSFIISLFH